MVNISGGYGRFKTWVTNRFLKKDGDRMTGDFEMWARFKTDKYIESDDNLFLGIDVCGAGNLEHTAGIEGYGNIGIGFEALKTITKGARNLAVGYRSLRNITTANYNMAFGGYSLQNATTGGYNMGFGYNSLGSNISGVDNCGVGDKALYSNVNGDSNVGIGRGASYNQQNGNRNVAIGNYAGKGSSLHDKSGCVFIGFQAGYYESGSSKLLIDNTRRANEADARIKALIYGVFDAAIANQLVRLNAVLEITSIKSGATQAAAGASANEVWKTNGHVSLPDNVLMIGV